MSSEQLRFRGAAQLQPCPKCQTQVYVETVAKGPNKGDMRYTTISGSPHRCGKQRGHSREWTTGEESLIREKYGPVSAAGLATLLGRTRDSVRKHIFTMRSRGVL